MDWEQQVKLEKLLEEHAASPEIDVCVELAEYAVLLKKENDALQGRLRGLNGFANHLKEGYAVWNEPEQRWYRVRGMPEDLPFLEPAKVPTSLLVWIRESLLKNSDDL